MSLMDYLRGKRGSVKENSIETQHKKEALSEELMQLIREGDEKYPEDMRRVGDFLEQLVEEVREHMESEPEDSVDAAFKIYISKDKMVAYGCIFPPINDGKDIVEEVLRDELRYEGVSDGIDDRILTYMAKGPRYLKLFGIARGTDPIDGSDGTVTDYYERKIADNLEADENNVINFEKPALYQLVRKGELICRIQMPGIGIDGKDVIGNSLTGKSGKEVTIPNGRNTVLSSDGTKLTARIDGVVSFEDGKFLVDERKLIDGDVDQTVGNIEFAKDVIVNGNVCNGFSIRAGGDVVVCGTVRECTIISGGTIRLQKGIQGNGKGMLTARKEIQCYVMENSVAEANGNIYADVIMNSQVISGGSVYALGGRGLITGGTLSVAEGVEAKKIGNQSNCKNQINLGYSPEKKAELEGIQAELEATVEILEKIRKNAFSLKGVTVLSLEKKAILDQLLQQKQLYRQKEEKLLSKLHEAKTRFASSSLCRVSCEAMFPFTEINYGEKQMLIEKEVENCYIQMNAGELKRR